MVFLTSAAYLSRIAVSAFLSAASLSAAASTKACSNIVDILVFLARKYSVLPTFK